MSGGSFTRKQVFPDSRGVFAPLSLKVGGLDWIQSNVSFNPKKYTLRGLHFQVGEFAQTKLIKVINGEILDFIVDIREGSDDYMMLYQYHMESGDELLVPKGFAHGFITLTDNVEFEYKVDNYYSKESERCIRFNDTDLNINWESENPILNERDMNAPLLKDCDINI